MERHSPLYGPFTPITMGARTMTATKITADAVEAMCSRLDQIRTADNPTDFRKWVEDWATDSTAVATMLRDLWKELEDGKALYSDLSERFADKVDQVGDLKRQLAAANERAEKAERQAEYSWGVVANAYEGNWENASAEWQEMARFCEWPRPDALEREIAETDQ